ncbi:carbohydrate ABC transporter permease [Paenibacillus senegalensis]|uniref:carbohydrate ABC transporter permease n=1 Tax=Paenibacillus senegalensis TaxID=1465766 RepID=UPI00028949EC|nr:carbohydrate ABC transporter permease [Paenibacillus senegalensis]
MLHRSTADRIADWINYLVLAFIAATMLFPFFYIFAVSFSSYADYLSSNILLWPREWVTDAYQYILSSQNFIRSLWVTAYVTIIGTAVNLAMTSTMAYALSRPMLGQRVYLMAVLFTFLFSAGLIPTYLIVKETGLINSLWALIIPTAISPFNLIVMRQFFKGIPQELNEASLIDGANDFQTFVKVILPLSKPSLAAFGLFYSVSHWNSYFSGVLYLNDPAKWPIQVVLRQIVILNETTSTLQNFELLAELEPPPVTIQMAAILLATLPIVIVYPFLQKHFAKGVMLGSVKG